MLIVERITYSYDEQSENKCYVLWQKKQYEYIIYFIFNFSNEQRQF